MKMMKTLQVKMMIDKITICIVVVLSFFSCEKNKTLTGVWKIQTVKYLDADYEVRGCFKSEIIVFDESSNRITLPGFDNPLDRGFFKVGKNKITITGTRDCYFDSEISYDIDDLKLRLQSSKIRVECNKMQFKDKGMLDINFFESFLDSTNWSTARCKEFRAKVCGAH